MFVSIFSPEKEIFKGEVHNIQLPGKYGRFEVLENHASLISSLQEGKIILRTEEQSIDVDIKGGFVEINNNKVSVCVEPQ